MSAAALGRGRRRRFDIWSHFTYDDKDNKTVCTQCGGKISGKNTTNLKRHLQTTHPEIHAKIQRSRITDGKDDHGPRGNKASAARATRHDISTAFLPPSKHKTESKAQQTKEQAIARWIGRTGLPLKTIEDEDFVVMMEKTKESMKEEEEEAAPLQREALGRIQGGSDWSDLHHSHSTNSTSHNAELQDAAYPVAFFTAPGTSSLVSQRLRPPSSADAEEAGHRSARHRTADPSRTEQQMRVQEWENRMKVLAWEQELVREKRRAVQQKEKAFRMKKAYYKAKLKRMGEDVPASSSSGEDEEKMSNPVG